VATVPIPTPTPRFIPEALRKAWRKTWQEMFGAYRPERRYMRGPGSFADIEREREKARNAEPK